MTHAHGFSDDKDLDENLTVVTHNGGVKYMQLNLQFSTNNSPYLGHGT